MRCTIGRSRRCGRPLIYRHWSLTGNAGLTRPSAPTSKIRFSYPILKGPAFSKTQKNGTQSDVRSHLSIRCSRIKVSRNDTNNSTKLRVNLETEFWLQRGVRLFQDDGRLVISEMSSSLEKTMRRTSIMTLGFVLIFIGIQLNLVETYVLTPRFSNFLMEGSAQSQPMANSNAQNQNYTSYNSPYYQASFPNGSSSINQQKSQLTGLGTPKTVSPPSWLCWPILFLGTVVFLHGFSVRRD